MTDFKTASFREKLIMVEDLAGLAKKIQMAFKEDLQAGPSHLRAIDLVIGFLEYDIRKLRRFIDYWQEINQQR